MLDSKQGTLVLVGFWGRGNAGDEAMLQCICAEFSSRFDLVLSVDEHGAMAGYWDWHPYRECRIVHREDTSFFDGLENPVGLLVGGGGLPPGLAGGQVYTARMKGMRACMAGVDLWPVDMTPGSRQPSMLKHWLDVFDMVSPRTEEAMSIATRLGVPALHGADWALRLPTDDHPDVAWDDRRVAIVLREDGNPSLIDSCYVQQVEKLLSDLEGMGLKPVLLPFSHEDEQHILSLGLDSLAPVERCWWNACRLKEVIARSGLTVSIGRLHPIIFGAPTGRGVAWLTPPHWGVRPARMSKVRAMAQELGVKGFESSADLMEAIRSGDEMKADPQRVSQSLKRLDIMTSALHGMFRT